MATRMKGVAQHRNSRWIGLGAVVVLAVAGLIVVRWANQTGTDASPSTRPAGSQWETKTIEAGAVTVKLQPTEFGAGGALVKVSLDTHSADLGVDLATAAQLVVNGTAWPVAEWSGDGPGGHHRSGELRFTAAGTAAGTVTLTIGGLQKPVVATWTVGA